MKIIILGIGICLLFGCKNNSSEDFKTAPPVFKDTVTLTKQIINDSLITDRVGNIALYKNYLIVKAITKDDKLLSIFDKNTGEFIESFANIGRGPGEVNSLSRITIDPLTGDLFTRDQTRKRSFKYNVDSVLNNHLDYYEPIIFQEFEQTLDNIRPCYGGLLLLIGKSMLYHSSPRYAIVNDNKEVIATYNTYPKLHENETDSVLSLMYECFGSTSVISPDGTKLAAITAIGGILEIFNITNDGILLEMKQGFYKPKYDTQVMQGCLIAQMAKETAINIGDVYATNTYLYIQFLGPDRQHFMQHHIGVFDWKGNPVKLYKTDCEVDRFCVDEQDTKLYAVTNPEGHLIYFNL